MTIQETMYKGRKIVIDDEGDPPKVTIDGENIPVFHNVAAGNYTARLHSPFVVYASLIDLAKGITDEVINIRPRP